MINKSDMKYYFHDLFNKQGIKAVYKGQTLYLYHHIELRSRDILKIDFISSNSPYKQAITISVIEPKRKKYLELEGDRSESFNLWEMNFPQTGAYITALRDIKVAVWNAWETVDENGKTRVWSAMQNAAMKIESKGNKHVYYCNDGQDDEDFDDLVFEITVIPKE